VTEKALDLDGVIADATGDRRRRQRRMNMSALAVSLAVTVTWVVFVSVRDHWDRVVDNWVAAVTMIAGSFVAGATPQGGGAVAFPVFTKGLDVPSEVARTFSLCIQTVGMGAATAALLLRRRPLEMRTLAYAIPAALGGFLLGYFTLTDRSELFSPSVLPGAYTKVGFTMLVATMAYVVHLAYRVHVLEVHVAVRSYTSRFVACLVGTAFVGGVISSQVGSGSDVLLYLTLVVLAGVSPRIGVPTSVVVMASVSVLGFLVLGVVDGQLDIALSDAGVVAVGGESTAAPLDAGRFDLFGLWIAAVPVVAWGAPLGAWVTSKVTDRQLVTAVLVLAAIEIVSTIVFIDELRTDPGLLAFAVVGSAVLLALLGWAQRHRVALLGLQPLAADAPLTRSRLDVGRRYHSQVVGEPDDLDDPRHHGLGGE